MLEALDGDSNNFFLSEDLDSKTACEVLATQQFLRQDPDLLTYLNTILTRKIKEYNKSHTEKFQLACLAKIVITLLYSKSQCGLDRELNFFQIKQAVCNSDIDRFYEIFRKYSNELRIQFEDPEFSPAELEVEFSRIQKIQEDLSSNLNEKQCCEFPNPSGNKYFVINAPISGHKAYIVVECDQGGKPLKLTYIDGNCLARFNGNDEFGYGGLTSIIKDKFMNIGSVLEEIEKYGPISTLNRRDYFNDVEAIIEGVCLLDNMEGSLYTKLQTHQNCVGKSAGLLERFLVQKLHETDEHDAECLVKAHKYAVVEMSATISAGFLANKELQGTKYDLLRSTPDSAVKAAFNHAVFKKARFEERYKEYEQNGGEEPKSKIATLNLQSRVIELMQAPIDRVVRDCLLPQLKSRASLSNIQETIADKDRAESMNLKIFGSGDVANSSSTPPKKKDSQSATSTPESRVKDLPATGGDSSEGIPETPKSNPTGANRFSPTTIFSPCAKVERSPEKVTKLVSASGKIVYYVGSGTVV
jgi:hypothetical protein